MAQPADLLTRLLALPPRETSGARTQNRFQYQICWALCRMLKIHAEGRDYRILFDFHDDVVELNAGSAPTEASFIQVKTKRGKPHTRTELLKRKKTVVNGQERLGSSILGRLLESGTHFEKDTAALVFVNNCGCALKCSDGTDSHTHAVVPFDDLSDREKRTISKRLSEELSISEPDLPLGIIELRHSRLSLSEPDVHTIGRTEEFLEKVLPTTRVRPRALFRALHGEASRRSSAELTPTTVKQLCDERSISRTDLERMLADLGAYAPFDEIVAWIRADLVSQGVPPLVATHLASGCDQYVMQRIGGENQTLAAAREEMVEACRALLQAKGAETLSLRDLATRTVESAGPALADLSATYSPAFVVGMALVVIYELASESQDGIPPPSEKPPSGAS